MTFKNVVRWMGLFLLWFSPFMMVMTASLPIASAAQGPQTFTLDGRIKQAGTTTPILDASVRIEVHVMNPSRTCVLYAEEQFVNTQTSNGYFNIAVGSNVGAGKRIAGVDPGLAMATVFQNNSAMTGTNVAGQTCAGGLYTPTTRDSRYFRIFVTPSSTAVTDQLADIILDAVPTAMVAESAESVGGFGPADLLRVNTAGSQVLSQANLENVFTSSNYAVLTALLAGTSNLYNKPAANGTNVLPTIAAPASPAAGQIWYNAGNVYYHDGTSVRTISTGSSTSISAADGTAAAPTIGFASDPNTGWYLAGPDNLAASTGGVERARINENGNLGIGSSAPGARLTLGGDASASAWQAGGIGIRQNSTNYTDTSSSGTVGFNYVNAFGVPTLLASSATTYTNASSFSMYPPVPGTNVTLTNSTALTINATALTGGGGVTNGYGLQVNAPTGATNNYAATFMGGHVGIGTTAPSSALDVKGTLSISGSTSGAVAFAVPAVAGSATYTWPAAAPASNMVLQSDNTGALTWVAANAGSITELTGDVTASGTGSVAATIPNDTVTFAKMQNIATQRLLGRSSATTGDVEELQVGTGLTITGGSLNLTDTTDDDSFATLLGVCGDGFMPYRDGGVWTCLEARSDLVNDTLVLRSATGSFEGNQVTANSLRLNNAGAYVSINTPAAANYTLTLPANDGTASGQVLTTDGSGVLTWTTPVASGGTGLFADGTAAAPSISFTSDPDTGIYRVGANELGFSANGSQVANMTTTTFGLNGIGMAKLQNGIGAGAPTYSFATNENTGMFRPGANQVGFSTNGTEKVRILADGKVGIGTTAPDTMLHVAGTIRVGDGAETCAGGNFTGGIRYNSGSLQFCDGTAWTTLGTGSGSGDFLANGSVDMTGTFKAVAGTAALPGITFTGDTNNGIYAPAADNVAITTAGTERLRIDSNGNMGLGTTPGQILTVRRDQNAQTAVSVNNFDGGTASRAAATINASGSSLNINSHGSGYATSGSKVNSGSEIEASGVGGLSVVTSHASGVQRFYTAGTSAANERMRIDSAGLVGIGTTAPDVKLHVAGTLRVGDGAETCSGGNFTGGIRYNSGNLQFCDGTAWTTLGTGSGSGDFMANGSVDMTGTLKAIGGTEAAPGLTFVGDTNTGIGNDNDGYIFFSSNGVAVAQISSNGLDMSTVVNGMGASSASAPSYSFTGAANADTGIFNPANDVIGISTAGSERMRFDASGNVGIGTTAPDVKLHVAGTLRVGDGAETCSGGNFTGGIRYNSGNLQFCNGTAWTTLGTGSGSGDFLANGSVDMTGTLKHVAGTAALPGITFVGDTNTGLSAQTADKLVLSTAGSARMTVDSAGLVGVGVDTPEYTLDVQTSGSDNGLRLSDGTRVLQIHAASSASGIAQANDTRLFFHAGSQNSGGFAIAPWTGAGSPGLRVAGNNGNVGIGTSAPTVSLDVAGTLRIGNGGELCPAVGAGGLRYNSGDLEICDGSTWTAVGGGGGGGATDIDGLSDGKASGTNVFLGSSSGDNIAAGTHNLGVGANSGQYVSSGSRNTIVGAQSGVGVTTHNDSTAIGHNTLYKIAAGKNGNTAVGAGALFNNGAGVGEYNTAIGYSTMNQATGDYNIAMGISTLDDSSSGDHNVAMGYYAGSASSGSNNILLGQMVYTNTSGSDNVLIGREVFQNNGAVQTAAQNVVIGGTAGGNNVSRTAANNVILGFGSAIAISSGSNNVILGKDAGNTLTTGGSNILIGTGVLTPANNTSNYLNIGNTIYGNTSTGLVGIGTTAPTAKLDVAGTLKIGNGAELCPAVGAGGLRYNSGDLEICDGATWTAVGGGGGSSQWTTAGSEIYYDGGNVGIGTTVPGFRLHVVNTNTANADMIGSFTSLNVNPSIAQAASRENIGNFSEVKAAGSSAVGDLIGSYSYVDNAASSTSADSLVAGQFEAHHLTSTANTVTGVKITSEGGGAGSTTVTGAEINTEVSGGTTTDHYGIKITNTNNSTTTNSYGIYLDASVSGTVTNNYGIYQNASAQKNYFAGSVGIGTTAPTVKLDVAGTLKIGNGAELCPAVGAGGLRYNSGDLEICDGATWTALGGGGSLTHFTESVHTAAPNATVPVVRMIATNAATNVDLALSPKGTGALTAHVADSAATGGNKRGSSSVDWQLSRSAATQVASGGNAVLAGGTGNTVSGTAATLVGGSGGTASGNNTFLGGGLWNTASGHYGAILGGQSNTASGQYSAVLGGHTNVSSGQYSLSSGDHTTAESYAQTTFGRYNMPTGAETAASWVTTDPLFVIGNGTGSGASRSTAMMVLKNGNVGIGTTAPTTKMDVAGTLRVGDGGETCGANYTGGLRYNSGAMEFCNGTSWAALGSGGGLPAADGSAATPSISFTSDPDTGMYLAGANSVALATNGTARMTIDATGNISAGGSITGGSLYAIGSIATTTGSVQAFSAGAANAPSFNLTGSGLFRPAANSLAVTTNNTERIRVDSTGNVGIGTTAPSEKLDVKGTFAISGSTSGAVKFAVPAAAGTATYTWPAAAPGSNMVLQSTSAGVLSWVAGGGSGDFLANGSVPMTGNLQLGGNWLSNDGGNEGIKVTNGGDVNVGSNSNPALMTVTGTSLSGGLMIKATDGTDRLLFTPSGSYSSVIKKQHASSALIFHNSTGSEEMRLDNNGRLGVGTDAPGATLHVVNAGTSAGDIWGTSYGDDVGILGRRGNGTQGSQTAVLVDEAIAVFGGMAYNSSWPSTSQGGMSLIASQNQTSSNQGTHLTFTTTANNTTTRSERMRIDNVGNVGIGSTNPQSKLEVNGRIVAGVSSDADALTSISADFSAANMIRATGAAAACGTLNFTNVAAGGSYTVTIPNASATCTTIHLNGATTNVKLPSGYTGGEACSGAVYTAIYDGTTLWVSYIPF